MSSDESGPHQAYRAPYQELLLNAITGLQDEVAALRKDIAKQTERMADEIKEQDRLRHEAVGGLTVKIAVLETKIAVYAGLGSVGGSTIITLLVAWLEKHGMF